MAISAVKKWLIAGEALSSASGKPVISLFSFIIYFVSFVLLCDLLLVTKDTKDTQGHNEIITYLQNYLIASNNRGIACQHIISYFAQSITDSLSSSAAFPICGINNYIWYWNQTTCAAFAFISYCFFERTPAKAKIVKEFMAIDNRGKETS